MIVMEGGCGLNAVTALIIVDYQAIAVFLKMIVCKNLAIAKQHNANQKTYRSSDC